MTNLPYIPTEYNVKPGLKKLEEEKHFIIDELYSIYRNEKMNARHEKLEKYYIEEPICPPPPLKPNGHYALMKTVSLWMAEALAKQYEKISFQPEEELYVLHNDYSNESVWVDEDLNVVQIIKSPNYWFSEDRSEKYPAPAYKNLFDAVCSQIQEDVCILQDDKLVASHVCLPSWWSPEEKMRKSMKEMHKDVPGMDETSYEHIWNASLHKGPYIRYNWTLTDTPILNQHPSKNIGREFDRENLFLRIERQVLQGFPEVHGVLFLIRTYVGDIKTLDKQQRVTLGDVVNKMSADELEYKGLTSYKENVVSYLNS